MSAYVSRRVCRLTEMANKGRNGTRRLCLCWNEMKWRRMMLVRSCCLGPEYQRRDFGQEGGASDALKPITAFCHGYCQLCTTRSHAKTQNNNTRILYSTYKDYSTKSDSGYSVVICCFSFYIYQYNTCNNAAQPTSLWLPVTSDCLHRFYKSAHVRQDLMPFPIVPMRPANEELCKSRFSADIL